MTPICCNADPVKRQTGPIGLYTPFVKLMASAAAVEIISAQRAPVMGALPSAGGHGLRAETRVCFSMVIGTLQGSLQI